MAIRTIDAPGIEIHEIDKSQYSPAMTGTKVLVTGFANSGEDYIPMIFTSKNAWLSYYGAPDNEAERYFYAASMEVLNQNGIVNCCKLPYENEARDKFVGQKYKLITSGTQQFTSVSESLSEDGQFHELYGSVQTSNKYKRDVLKFFMEIFNVTDAEDKVTIQDEIRKESPILGVLNGNVNSTDRSDGRTAGGTFFEVYTRDPVTGVYKYEYDVGMYVQDIETLKQAFLLQMTKAQFISYLRDAVSPDRIPNMDAFWYMKENILFPNQWTPLDEIAEDLGETINSMGTCVYSIVNAINSLPDSGSAIKNALNSRDNLKNYFSNEGKTVRDLTLSIKELAQIANNGNEITATVVSNPKTTKDYYDILQACIDSGGFDYNLGTINVQQQISVVIGYDIPADLQNSAIQTITLSAENTFTYPPDPEDQETEQGRKFIIDTIDYLTLKNRYTEGVLSDDFFAGFTKSKDNYAQAIETFPVNGTLTCSYESGIDAFRIAPTRDIVSSDVQKIRDVVSNGWYNLKQANSLEEIADYFTNMRAFFIQTPQAVTEGTIESVKKTLEFCEIYQADKTVKDFWRIEANGNPSLYTLDEVDEYRTDESRVPTNQILIVDKTRKPYVKVPEDKSHKNDTREVIGIIPIITTAANGLYAQSLIDVDDEMVTDYETIKRIQTLDCSAPGNEYKFNGKPYSTFNVLEPTEVSATSIISQRFNNEHTEEDNDADFFDSLALQANSYFSSIALQADGGFDRENMKKIGLVVVKAYLDASEGNKISFQIVESFVGSLNRDEKNPNTGATVFIDTIVNEQSEYVNIFTNCMPTDALKDKYNKEVDIIVMPHQTANVASMGFYEGMTEEDIDVSESILKALDIVYDKVTDINEREIDIVVDGGISNIAQFIKTVYEKKGFYDPMSTDAAMWKCKKDNDVKMWKTVIMKMDNFCKNIRKDCMFIADGPRPYCLQGQKKIVRPSKPKNTIDVNILPYTKYLTGINTSYGAGYCDWFQIADEFSGDYFWCPPSIKACGIYIYTDLNFEYWDAPAGLNRGIVAALDVAFSPTIKQAGQIYTKNWNYAINYPQDGIVLEGQKTLQTKPSALDRVNVRRLLLRLERATYKVLRYVVYEGNTAYMRQRVVDLLDPYFKEAKVGGGVYDYKIICDESNNTPTTIDRNELHISIGIKPTKTIEFIICNFVILPTGASWDEL